MRLVATGDVSETLIDGSRKTQLAPLPSETARRTPCDPGLIVPSSLAFLAGAMVAHARA
jgi:hypothetical protein